MKQNTSDIRIAGAQPLITPGVLAEQLPLSASHVETITRGRREIADALTGTDGRVVAIVGPCSVHDPAALMEFAEAFRTGTEGLKDALVPVLRVYFEKPRTVVGWKGLINDPHLDGSFHVNKGLHQARQVLLDVAARGLPAASEFLDTILGQYYAELVSFGAIGARTVESQIHRELASGLSMPVGFKNGTGGQIDVALDAIASARHPHWFPSLTHEGTPAILQSTGNPHGYLILRGGKHSGPNFDSGQVSAAVAALAARDLPANVIIDCSHGNSEKDHRRQAQVLMDVADQVQQGQSAVTGVMLESHLVAGSQTLHTGETPVYGQSITDACLSLADTLPLLESLAEAVRRAGRV